MYPTGKRSHTEHHLQWDPRRAGNSVIVQRTRRYVVLRLVPKPDTGQDKRLGHSGIQSLRLARRVIGESSCAFSLFFAHSRRLCCLQIYTTKQKESKMSTAFIAILTETNHNPTKSNFLSFGIFGHGRCYIQRNSGYKST